MKKILVAEDEQTLREGIATAEGAGHSRDLFTGSDPSLSAAESAGPAQGQPGVRGSPNC